jgi:hypothetical protein
MPGRLKRIVFGLGAAVIALIVAGWLLSELLENAMCGNDYVQSLKSPDSKHLAVLFQRDCGATTSFSTQASIFPRDVYPPNKPGNIFVIGLKGDGPTGYWHGPIARIRWLDNRTLEIRYDHTARTFHRESRSGIVEVHYVVD